MTAPTTGTFTSPSDGLTLATYTWGADLSDRRGIVQIAHGLAEHGRRYGRFADALVAAGWTVVAVDHRGHGASVDAERPLGSFDFALLCADVAALGTSLVAENPGEKVVLFGHSMGSFATQAVLLEHSATWAAAVLSGSSAVDKLIEAMMANPQPEAAGLEAFNAAFDHRTGYEWLSRDESEVDLYVADPLCGFDVDEASMFGMFGLAAGLSDPTGLAGIRSDLPVLITSGTADPLAGEGALLELLGQRYREAGVKDVTVTLYPEGRHEILNETNRDQVTADIVSWLGAHA